MAVHVCFVFVTPPSGLPRVLVSIQRLYSTACAVAPEASGLEDDFGLCRARARPHEVGARRGVQGHANANGPRARVHGIDTIMWMLISFFVFLPFKLPQAYVYEFRAAVHFRA